jgi:small subunit ribosomal protein S13
MVYVNNVFLLPNQKIRRAIQKIYGIGPHLANQICDQLGFSENFSMKNCTKTQLDQLSQLIHQSYITGSELQQLILKDKRRFITIGCYKGLRQINKLPVRGQRTKTNARTCRKLKK